MTAPATPPTRPPRDLTARLFRALYTDFDLHSIGAIHIVVPKGTPWLTGHSLADLARQITRGRDARPPPAFR